MQSISSKTVSGIGHNSLLRQGFGISIDGKWCVIILIYYTSFPSIDELKPLHNKYLQTLSIILGSNASQCCHLGYSQSIVKMEHTPQITTAMILFSKRYWDDLLQKDSIGNCLRLGPCCSLKNMKWISVPISHDFPSKPSKQIQRWWVVLAEFLGFTFRFLKTVNLFHLPHF